MGILANSPHTMSQNTILHQQQSSSTNIIINARFGNSRKDVNETMVTDDKVLNSVVSHTTLTKLRALQDLEINMTKLENIIIEKDQVIDGLRR